MTHYEPAPGQPTVADFDTEARHALTASVRRLIDATLTSERLDDATMLAARATLDAVADTLVDGEPEPGVRSRFEGTHADYLPRSPVVGRCSPMAPPVQIRMVGTRLVGDVTFGAAYEGPPGYVHGGVLALVFDEVLGMVNLGSDHPGMTAVLTVKYRRPTPLYRPTVLEGWVERVEGRKAITRGRITVDGEVTAEVEGLFVTPDMERIMEYFGRRDETPDPLP
ncbi:MAG: PaaI family thioesterase [Acidimicrobiia bacterium]